MKKKSGKKTIKITSHNATVTGNVHYGTYIKTTSGHVKKAVKAAVLIEEQLGELGETQKIILEEKGKRVMGNESVGLALDVSRAKKEEKLRVPLEPDSPLMSPVASKNEESADKAAALYKKLTTEEGGMTIEIDEDGEKTKGGHQLRGFLMDTKQRSDSKGLPIASDSPIAPPPTSKVESSVAVITDSGSFTIDRQGEGIYRVEIDYSDFNHDGASKIHAILERYTTENGYYLKGSCVINRHLNLITSLDFADEVAANRLVKELNDLIDNYPSLRF